MLSMVIVFYLVQIRLSSIQCAHSAIPVTKCYNYDYEEKFYHGCFIEAETTIDESMCGNCFSSYALEIERSWKKINQSLSE